MRSLSFGGGATAWLSPRLMPGKPFGAELFFRDGDWRISIAIVYGEDGQLNRIVHIREHRNGFSHELPNLETSDISGDWVVKQRSLTLDLNISPGQNTQISFNQLSDHQLISLPGGMVAMLPEKRGSTRSDGGQVNEQQRLN